jgi:hypothetical protein
VATVDQVERVAQVQPGDGAPRAFEQTTVIGGKDDGWSVMLVLSRLQKLVLN